MPNIDKTQQLRKKFNSTKVDKQISSFIDGILGDTFVFLSFVKDLPYNTVYIEEFCHIYSIEEFEDEVVLLLATIDDLCRDYVGREDVIMMLAKMKTAIDSLFVYTDGKKKMIDGL